MPAKKKGGKKKSGGNTSGPRDPGQSRKLYGYTVNGRPVKGGK